MNDYTPRVSHFFVPLCMAAIGGVFLYSGWIVMAWLVFSLTALSGLFIFWIGWLQTRAEFMRSVASPAHELQTLNPEQYRALGIRVPELRVYSSGTEPIIMVEDRNLKYEFLRELLIACDDKQFVPSSRYDKETVDLKQWKEAANLLMERGYLIVGSAAGNHTLFWHNGGRAACIAAYFGNETKLMRLEVME